MPAELARERAELATWLSADPLSPYAALGLQPIGAGISVGAEPSDIPLPGVARGIITETGAGAVLTTGSERRALPRNQVLRLGTGFRMLVTGSPGRTAVAVFGSVRGAKPPSFYPYHAAARSTARLEAPERRGRFRVLGLDGAETEAVEAGFITVAIAGTAARLRVYRVGAADDEEAPLQIFFRDSTNSRGSYPAGRFVEVVPVAGGAYEVDFNRARNPYCAYSSIFPCPAPWPGNAIAARVEAGERYAGGGLDPGAR